MNELEEARKRRRLQEADRRDPDLTIHLWADDPTNPQSHYISQSSGPRKPATVREAEALAMLMHCAVDDWMLFLSEGTVPSDIHPDELWRLETLALVLHSRNGQRVYSNTQFVRDEAKEPLVHRLSCFRFMWRRAWWTWRQLVAVGLRVLFRRA